MGATTAIPGAVRCCCYRCCCCCCFQLHGKRDGCLYVHRRGERAPRLLWIYGGGENNAKMYIYKSMCVCVCLSTRHNETHIHPPSRGESRGKCRGWI